MLRGRDRCHPDMVPARPGDSKVAAAVLGTTAPLARGEPVHMLLVGNAEQPNPRNMTMLCLLQVSRGSRAQRGMDPVSSRSPPGPTRSKSSPNKCVSSEVSPWEPFLPGDKQPPGPQEESADPVATCPRGTQAPVHSGPAAFLTAAQEMPQEDGEACKREYGRTAGSSTAIKETLLGTDGKEQGPGPQGDAHGPSPSGQAEWAPLQSEGAPRGQSGQVSESPSISYGDMGPPELLLGEEHPHGRSRPPPGRPD